MREIEITGSAASKFEGGYPQISLKDFANETDFTNNGEWVALIKGGHFVASAYLAKEGNGYGWILSRKENQEINENFFTRIIKRAFNQRLTSIAEQTNAYRLFNGQGDGLGGINIDNYGGEIVISWENEGIYQQRNLILPAIAKSLETYQNIYEIKRFEGNSSVKPIFDLAPDAQEFKEIIEDGTTYPVHLDGASKTGLDLIFRDVRKQVKKNSNLKLVLNLLYDQTGVVSASITGGSNQTENVDQSKRAKSDLVQELVANDVEMERQKVRSMDLNGFLDYATKHNLHFDLITINLPTFMRSKKGNFNIRKDLTKLLTKVFGLASAQADLFVTTQTNAVNLKDFRNGIQTAITNSKHKFIEKEQFKTPIDFPVDREYLKNSPFKGLWFKLQK